VQNIKINLDIDKRK